MATNNEPFLSQKRIELIKKTKLAELDKNGNPKFSEDEKDLFIEVCQSCRLDPLTDQIYAIQRDGKLSIEPSIEGLLIIAVRTGEYDGNELAWTDGSEDENGEPVWHKSWLPTRGDPEMARAIVYHKKRSHPEVQTAAWNAYAKSFKGELGWAWSKYPSLMLAKCALALALKRTFPDLMSGFNIPEEMREDEPKEKETTKLDIKDYKLVVPVKTAPPASQEETQLREEAKAIPPRNEIKHVLGEEVELAEPTPEPEPVFWREHVITSFGSASMGKKFNGRKVGSLIPGELDMIARTWLGIVESRDEATNTAAVGDKTYNITDAMITDAAAIRIAINAAKEVENLA